MRCYDDNGDACEYIVSDVFRCPSCGRRHEALICAKGEPEIVDGGDCRFTYEQFNGIVDKPRYGGVRW